MARRHPSPSQAKRNENARTLGYRNYYDYRIHNHGRIPPSSPAPRGEARERLRGHRGPADLLERLTPGSHVTVHGWERDAATGRYRVVELDLLDDETGQHTIFKLRGYHLKRANLREFVEQLQAAGASLAAGGSLDVRRLTTEVDHQ